MKVDTLYNLEINMNAMEILKKKRVSKRQYFTMIELIAVIVISSILVTIALKIMKTDSAKANAQTFGSFINLCQASAMSYGDSSKYVIVEMNVGKNIHNENQLLNVSMYIGSKKPPVTATTKITVDGTAMKVQSFAPGSRALKSDGAELPATTSSTHLKWYFNSVGEPVNDVGSTETSGYSLFFRSRSSTATGTENGIPTGSIPVFVKPFTGKVTYYTP